MTDQAEEIRQMEIEDDILTTLDKLYGLVHAWDGGDYPELHEEMLGYVAEWKAKIECDGGAFDS